MRVRTSCEYRAASQQLDRLSGLELTDCRPTNVRRQRIKESSSRRPRPAVRTGVVGMGVPGTGVLPVDSAGRRRHSRHDLSAPPVKRWSVRSMADVKMMAEWPVTTFRHSNVRVFHTRMVRSAEELHRNHEVSTHTHASGCEAHDKYGMQPTHLISNGSPRSCTPSSSYRVMVNDNTSSVCPTSTCLQYWDATSHTRMVPS